MKQISSFENEVRPGVLMTVVSLLLFKASSFFISRYGGQIWPPCLIRTKIFTFENEKFCGVLTPGLTSSSNGENCVVLSFSERSIMLLLQVFLEVMKFCNLGDQSFETDFSLAINVGNAEKILDNRPYRS